MEEIIQDIYDAILTGEADAVKENIQVALGAGLDPNQIFNEGMIDAVRKIG
ncbi:MAG: B12-binding domain-containing protein [Anaerolineales bacterium]|jgi:methanogenic corrinoid protein MtbC1|nr:B12-binding domain-containing protein [Anaerolineales bacterium]